MRSMPARRMCASSWRTAARRCIQVSDDGDRNGPGRRGPLSRPPRDEQGTERRRPGRRHHLRLSRRGAAGDRLGLAPHAHHIRTGRRRHRAHRQRRTTRPCRRCGAAPRHDGDGSRALLQHAGPHGNFSAPPPARRAPRTRPSRRWRSPIRRPASSCRSMARCRLAVPAGTGAGGAARRGVGPGASQGRWCRCPTRRARSGSRATCSAPATRSPPGDARSSS